MSATYASTELTVVQCWCGILFRDCTMTASNALNVDNA